MNNLVQEIAPQLALPPRSQWVTPEPDAGMAPPENLYDAQGNPLNWIQDAGGQRQFLSTGGPVASPSAPVRTRSSAAPDPMNSIRGRTNPETGTFGSTVPLMPRPAPAPIRGRIGLEPEVPTQTPYVAPRATVRVPSEIEERVTQQSNRQRQVEDRVIGAAFDSRAAGNMRNPRQQPRAEQARPVGEGAQSRGIGGQLNVNPNGSLLEMLQSLNFNVRLPLRGRSSGTEDSNGLSPEQLGLPTIDRPVDIYADINSGGRVTPASAGPPGSAANSFDLSTDNGRMAFQRLMGVTLTPGQMYRSQQEQDALFNAGHTRARRSRHTSGQAFDISPREIGGLRGQEAVREVRRRFVAAYGEEAANGMSFEWHTIGTAPHVHTQPIQ